jgi:hypothetical protein
MTPQDLRLMRKKARVSLDVMAKELGLSIWHLGDLEAGRKPWGKLADRYVESLIKLTGPVAEWQTQPTQNRLGALQTPELQVQVLPGLPFNHESNCLRVH